MGAPSLTYSLTNGTTADASQVMQNFNDLLNGYTDGTKDLSISALTVAGTLTANGDVAIGNASADTLTVTASLGSSIPVKTNNTYDIGSATLGLRKLYIGNGGAGSTCDIVAASHATTREYTIPDCGAAANFVMSEVAQTINGIKTFGTSIKLPSAAATASALNFYAEDDTTMAGVTFNGTGAGSTAGAGVTIRITRIGRLITIMVPEVTDVTTAAASAAIQCGTNLPTWARPAVSTACLSGAYIAASFDVSTDALIEITTGGTINVYRNVQKPTWGNAAGNGFRTFNVTYAGT